MGLERRDQYWLWVGGPVPTGAAAMTIGRLVLVRAGAAGDEVLLRHEAEHVAQYRAHGFFGFLVRYLADYARLRLRGYRHWPAYRRIAFEVQAEWVSRRWAAGRERGQKLSHPAR